MIEGGRLPGGGPVTAFARRGRREVVWTHSGGSRAIMTARTIAADSAVVERRGVPRTGRVAGIALGGGADMRRRLAARLDPVVARGAAGCHCRVVEACDRPLAGGMAAVAIGFGSRVIGWFAFGPHRVVTIGAAPRGALELAVLVAILASHGGVFARKRETGPEVIEGLCRGRRLRRRRSLCRRYGGCRDKGGSQQAQEEHQSSEQPHNVILSPDTQRCLGIEFPFPLSPPPGDDARRAGDLYDPQDSCGFIAA